MNSFLSAESFCIQINSAFSRFRGQIECCPSFAYSTIVHEKQKERFRLEEKSTFIDHRGPVLSGNPCMNAFKRSG